MNEDKIKSIVEDKFGKNISSLIFPYLIGECRICKKCKFNSEGLSMCEGCDKLICENKCYARHFRTYDTFSTYFHNIYKNYCPNCYVNSMMNNNN